MATVPQLKRYGHEKPREFVLLASYCSDDTPGCTDTTPCADCLAMCNVFDESGKYLRELGSAPKAADLVAENERLRAAVRQARAQAIENCLEAINELYPGGAHVVSDNCADAIAALPHP